MAKVLMKGNEAVGKAAIEAGCRYFLATPSLLSPKYLNIYLLNYPR